MTTEVYLKVIEAVKSEHTVVYYKN